MKLFNRYKTYQAFLIAYLVSAFIVRVVLYFLSFRHIDFSIINIIKVFFAGFIFDLGTALYFSTFYLLYLLLLPKKITGSVFDRIITYVILFVTAIIAVFSFLAEFPFWEEFNARFNFIAVDYLIYTYEILQNIKQSYPLPVIIALILFLVFAFFFSLYKKNIFKQTFSDKLSFSKRFLFSLPIILVTMLYTLFVENEQAEWSDNLYENELSKNGVFSFFAAYRSNELDYDTFYSRLPDDKAFDILRSELLQNNQKFTTQNHYNIERKIEDTLPEIRPDIVLICMESMSAEFMQRFGNTQKITPNLDKLASASIFFSNMYATGTRTVRGMEALTLCVPPTPGNSIVRRSGNADLFSIATILKEKNYTNYFIYGGDGYFDNMNNFFGGQGFKIVDNNRGNPLPDNMKTERINIERSEVSFENAWGISDEDIYTKTMQIQNDNYRKNIKSFYFIMTTSNHKPYTFLKGKIDLPQGSRESAVKYADFALGNYLKKAETKEWFKNTIFVIVADHCASSAGRWAINIKNHHIPAMIYNLENYHTEVNKLASQIDLMPTVFGFLHWNYNSSFYGKDINLMNEGEERALVGNYRTLGLLTHNKFIEINDEKEVHQYEIKNNGMFLTDSVDENLKNKTISYYQTASYRFKHHLMYSHYRVSEE